MAFGARPLSARDNTDVAELQEDFREMMSEKLPDEQSLDQRFKRFLTDLSKDRWAVPIREGAIAEAVVFDVKEIGDYVFSRHYGDDIASVTECVAPPFQSLWLDFGASWCPLERVQAWAR